MPANEVSKKDEWPITSNRYVGFIDIMGFKDMVATLPHNDIYEMMKRMNRNKKIVEGVSWTDTAPNMVRTTTYSDSIMLYSKDDSFDSLRTIVNALSSLAHYLFIEKIPHKGSLAFGLMTLDLENSIFFGQPLIDAFLLQEQLYFYGIILHSTVEYQIKEIHKKETTFLYNYLCPLKNGNAYHLTIYPIFLKTKTNKDKSKQMFEAIEKLRFKTSGFLRKYIDNTEAYLNTIVKNEVA